MQSGLSNVHPQFWRSCQRPHMSKDRSKLEDHSPSHLFEHQCCLQVNVQKVPTVQILVYWRDPTSSLWQVYGPQGLCDTRKNWSACWSTFHSEEPFNNGHDLPANRESTTCQRCGTEEDPRESLDQTLWLRNLWKKHTHIDFTPPANCNLFLKKTLFIPHPTLTDVSADSSIVNIHYRPCCCKLKVSFEKGLPMRPKDLRK